MKIKTLRLINIGPFKGEHSISFESLFQLDHLLCIHGPTGSGKSTLLNSFSLALFGKTFKSELRSTDFVTLGEASGEISLEVEHNHNNYSFYWRCTLKGKGNKILKEPRLERSVYKNKKPQAELSASEIIGLTFEQFTKAVILNQNTFSLFLTSKPRERRSLLEELYQLEEIGQIRKRLKSSLDLQSQNLELIASELKGLGAHSKEELNLFIDELKTQIKQMKSQIQEFQGQEKKLKHQLETLQKIKLTKEKMLEIESENNQALRQQESLREVQKDLKQQKGETQKKKDQLQEKLSNFLQDFFSGESLYLKIQKEGQELAILGNTLEMIQERVRADQDEIEKLTQTLNQDDDRPDHYLNELKQREEAKKLSQESDRLKLDLEQKKTTIDTIGQEKKELEQQSQTENGLVQKLEAELKQQVIGVDQSEKASVLNYLEELRQKTLSDLTQAFKRYLCDKNLKEEVNKLSIILSFLNFRLSEIQDSKKSSSGLKEKLLRLQSTIEVKYKDLSKKEEHLEKLKLEYKTLSSQLDQLEKKAHPFFRSLPSSQVLSLLHKMELWDQGQELKRNSREVFQNKKEEYSKQLKKLTLLSEEKKQKEQEHRRDKETYSSKYGEKSPQVIKEEKTKEVQYIERELNHINEQAVNYHEQLLTLENKSSKRKKTLESLSSEIIELSTTLHPEDKEKLYLYQDQKDLTFYNHLTQQIQEKYQSTLDKSKELSERVGSHGHALLQEEKKRERFLELNKDQEKLKKDHSLKYELYQILGGSKRDELRDFALSYLQEELIHWTNRQLREMYEGRYQVLCPNLDAHFMIKDNYYAFDIRKISSLSGGELFLISLAMSLGLSELIRGKTPIESFFIDEGFGSLDQDSLEDVINVLINLKNRQQQIGLITHVKELQERLDVALQVKKKESGESYLVTSYG